jgi:hypothetical protein
VQPNQTGFSPYEILFRRPPPLAEGIKRDLLKIGKSNLAPTVAQFGGVLNVLYPTPGTLEKNCLLFVKMVSVTLFPSPFPAKRVVYLGGC